MGLLLLIPYIFFNHSDGWNQNSRIAELHALVLHHSIRIDPYAKWTGDIAVIDGHIYSDKAPGIAVVALPTFAVTAWVQEAMGLDPDGLGPRHVSDWVVTAASVGLLATLGGIAFFRLVSRDLGERLAFLATIAVFLGSLVLPYATALFSHAGTIGLIAIAMWAMLDPPGGSGTPYWRDYLAGLAAGFAVASEYPAIFAAGSLGLYLLLVDRRRAMRFCAGGLPAFALVIANNVAVSGHPFVVAYGFNPNFPGETAANRFGHYLPTPGAIAGLLFGQYRGLFFWSPVLVMAVPGARLLAETNRRLALCLGLGIVLSVLQIAGFHFWFGGSAIGARYLAPIVPLVGLFAAHGMRRFPRVGLLLSGASVALMCLVTAISIEPSSVYAAPLRDFYVPRLWTGPISPNLGLALGLSPVLSLVLVGAAMTAVAGLLFRSMTADRRSEGARLESIERCAS